MALKRKKKSNWQKLVAKLDAVFSQYIRLRDASPSGYCKCISCGKVVHWKEIQDGHYEPRGNWNTRWDEENNHSQCMSCNVLRHGNMLAYRRNMVLMYGEERVQAIECRARQTRKWSEWELEEMITYYTALVDMLKKEKGL